MSSMRGALSALIPLGFTATMGSLALIFYMAHTQSNQENNSENQKTEPKKEVVANSIDSTVSNNSITPVKNVEKKASIYDYIGEIKKKKTLDTLEIVKLLDYSQYGIPVGWTSENSGYEYKYALPTFLVGNKRITLICDINIGYVKNANYNVRYWELAPGQTLNDELFYESYVYKKSPQMKGYNIEFSKDIDPSVKGIITKIERIDNE